MENGISLYPGLDNTLEENLQLLSAAAACGIRRVFTSLHIPETNTDVLKRELAEILAAARRYDMEIISDISPRTLSMLDMPEFDLAAFQKLGITTLRLDYGYSAEQMAELLRKLNDACKQMGCVIDSPYMTMAYLSLACVPELRLTNRGLVDCCTFRFTDIFTDPEISRLSAGR